MDNGYNFLGIVRLGHCLFMKNCGTWQAFTIQNMVFHQEDLKGAKATMGMPGMSPSLIYRVVQYTHEQQFTSSKSNSTFTDMLQKQHSFLEERKRDLEQTICKANFCKRGRLGQVPRQVSCQQICIAHICYMYWKFLLGQNCNKRLTNVLHQIYFLVKSQRGFRP